MASRRLVPASAREALLGIPSDTASLERNYLLADEDLDLIGTRRRPENRLGLAALQAARCTMARTETRRSSRGGSP